MMLKTKQLVDLRSKPYHLQEQDMQWVEDTLEKMSTEEKICHLFAPLGSNPDPDFLKNWVDKYKPGAVMFRPLPGKIIQSAHRVLQDASHIPLLLAANLEDGGNGLVEEGTYYGKPLQVAATDDEQSAYTLGAIAGKEAAAVGGNWAFAPIVDIDHNWRNPITNVRTFGSDYERVLRMGKAYKKGFDLSGGAVSIKHFPGDGMDERDQHLHVTYNTLSVDEWMDSYGKIYRELIEEGVHSVMVGHIAFPAYSRKKGVPDKQLKSATLSPELLQDLLREELGFNGLIITDATPMVAFATDEKRQHAIPLAVAAGCDMILFTRHYDEDIESMRQGLQSGLVTEERLDDAVRRILGVKASLGLHKKEVLVPDVTALNNIHCHEHVQAAKDLADNSITLVRDRENLLPVTSQKYKSIYLMPLGVTSDESVIKQLARTLEQSGFTVSVQDTRRFSGEKAGQSLQGLKKEFDLALFVALERTKSNRTHVRLNWNPFIALDSPWFSTDIPTVFISLANPYHLIDVPFVSTFINAYSDNEATINVLVDKLTGKSDFKGISPSDPYCGDRWDLHLYD
ncbi:glycoside hydrolase family 3 protein [Bacillus sp. WMMC1349]|uniref:glycoside hydrolase family 3 protein n=1 Tax=Bacillus sp. WMMC1349 TaxID=2736254 RepID=UPI0020A6D132|nr:glycoside hydrolase family 3 N-terminal domain-containing protein [Bacillus sp. WMMC1349]